jgi:hypothetical protein
MAALVAAIHEHRRSAWVFMGGRDKPGHDVVELIQSKLKRLYGRASFAFFATSFSGSALKPDWVITIR